MALQNQEWENIFTEAVNYLCELIRFKTVNPPGNEKPAADYLAEILSKNGLEPKVLESAPGRGNVIARLKGTGEKPPILLDGHLDVVSADPESDWKHPPFSGKIAEGYIWGRGALDMKQTVVMNLMAILTLKRAGVKLKRDLIFTAVADEENGCKYGAQFLVEKYPELVKAEYGLGEVGGFRKDMYGKHFYPIEVAEKGVCWFRITAKGDAGHGSIPAPDSAAIKLAEAIVKLGRSKLPIHITPAAAAFFKTISQGVGGAKGMVLSLLANPALSDFVNDKLISDKKLAKTFWAAVHNTTNPTVLRAGEKTNIIPYEASCEVDGRVLPGQTKESLLKEVKELIGDDFEIEVIHYTPPAFQDVNDPIMKIFEKHIKEYDPEAIMLPLLMTGFTDASQYAQLGIKYFGFSPLKLGPGENFQELCHNKDERVLLDGYKFGLRIFIETVQELAG